MTDAIQIDVGADPWEPSPSAQLVEEYQRFNMPVAGVIEQDGNEFLFYCMAGRNRRVSMWGYARLDLTNRRQLDAAPHAELDNRLSDVMAVYPVALAVFVEDDGIVASSPISTWTEGATLLDDLLDVVVKRFRDRAGYFDGLVDDVQHLTALASR